LLLQGLDLEEHAALSENAGHPGTKFRWDDQHPIQNRSSMNDTFV
jgi:hypothetical protein